MAKNKKNKRKRRNRRHNPYPLPADGREPHGAGEVPRCEVCGCVMVLPGGCADSGMCGPCCTGEADTINELGDTW